MSDNQSVASRIEGYLNSILVMYARFLREDHPKQKIRNAAVIQAGLAEFERRKMVRLIQSGADLKPWMPPRIVRLVTSKRGRALWMPTRKMIRLGFDVLGMLKAQYDGQSITWSPGSHLVGDAPVQSQPSFAY